MKTIVNNIAFLTLTLMAVSASAQSSYELTCRAKAKEIATQTYSGCMSEARNTQIDQIRKDYQKQLADLKAKYDKELKKVGGKSAAPAAEAAAPAPTTFVEPIAKPTPKSAYTGSVPKPTKGIAKSLPTRKEVKTVAPAVQEVPEDRTVITPDSTTPGVEDVPAQNDAQGDFKIKLVPAPVSTSASADDLSY
jgi:hypothetical protein